MKAIIQTNPEDPHSLELGGDVGKREGGYKPDF